MSGVEVVTRKDSKSITIVDTMSSEQYSIVTSSDVRFTQCSVELPVPVSRTVQFETSELIIKASIFSYIRRLDGEMDQTLSFGDHAERSKGQWIIELSAPVKTYLLLDGPFSISVTAHDIQIRLPEEKTIILGVRTYRRHPESTITIRNSPDDFARALSLLGTSLETDSPERSFPTLRNHPPSIELGHELDVPDGLTPPETGVLIQTPYEVEKLFALAPLSFYLGARLIEGPHPGIVLESGEMIPLTSRKFITQCHKVLKQLVFLDCLTRTEGLYPYDLTERDQVDEKISLDWGELYDASLSDRTAAYLEVEYDTLEPHIPQWPACAFVQPDMASTEILPHLLDQLIPIHPYRPERATGSDARRQALDRFMQSADSPLRAGKSVFDELTFVDIPEPAEDTALWYGEGIPLGGNHLLQDGIRSYHSKQLSSPSQISVALVCNDPTMNAEVESAESIYGSRDRIHFEIDTYHQVGTEQLAELLAEPCDFFHFVGHASASGLHCPDGILQPSTLNSVAVRSFFLSACSSYLPGKELVENGAIGGVVTVSDVNDESAENVGVLVANLLNGGYSLRNALLIARTRSIVGGQYVCIGMESITLAQSEGGVTYACELNRRGSEWEIHVSTYPNHHWEIGSVATFQFDPKRRCILSGNSVGISSLTTEKVIELLRAEQIPISFCEDWHWSRELVRKIQ